MFRIAPCFLVTKRECRRKESDSLLMQASTGSRERGVVACVQMRNWTPIMVAAAEGGAAAVRSLVKHRAEVNASDLEGITPLMLAVSLGCNTEEKVGLLLFAGSATGAFSRWKVRIRLRSGTSEAAGGRKEQRGRRPKRGRLPDAVH